jgi:endonuclease-3
MEFTRQKHTAKVVDMLEKAYPERGTALEFSDPWQLLIATILSAQCTDVMVNKVTPGLFEAYADPCALGHAEIGDVERIVKPTGFYHNKAKSIVAASLVLCEQWHGVVTPDLAVLTKLPGVGRKTANVVLAHAFGQQAVVVDTHVKRLSYRIGLSESTDPVQVEQDIMAVVPKRHWNALCDAMIAHGRSICDARRPDCAACPINQLCPKNGVVQKPRSG